jgi:uncharacterized repeat protein (TIGR02059 family)
MYSGDRMRTTARGRHRKLRRNILHTVIATALLAGTFTAVDQVSDQKVANAVELTGQAGELVTTTETGQNETWSVTVGSDGKYYTNGYANSIRISASGVSEGSATLGNHYGSAATSGGGFVWMGTRNGVFKITEGTATSVNFGGSGTITGVAYAPNSQKFYATEGSNFLRFDSTTSGATASSTTAMGGTTDELKIQTVDGVEYVVAAGAYGIKRFVASTGALDPNFTTITGTFTALAIDPTDNSILGGTSTNVFRYPANGGTGSAALLPSNKAVNSMAVDSKGRIVIGTSSSGSGVMRFSATGTPDAIFNANTNVAYPVNTIAIGLDGRIAATGRDNGGSPRWFRLIRGDSAPPDAPTLSNIIPSDQSVTATVTRSGTKIASSYKIYAVEDNSKFCIVSGTTPSTGNTTSTGGSCAVTGLTNGSAYTFKAIAYNLDEPSLESATSATTTPVDNAGPVFQSAAVDTSGFKLTMTYSEAINSLTAPTSAFVVKNGSATISVTAVTVNGSTIELTLASPIGAGLTASVAYNAPAANSSASNSAIQDALGNDSLTLATTNISSGNNQSTVDQTAPTITSATTNTAGDSITITLSEALSTTTASPGTFTVSNPGTPTYPVTVTGIALDSDPTRLVLTLSGPVGAGKAVTVSYAAPASNTSISNSAVQDLAGNDLASVTNRSITNISTADQSSPTSTGLTNSSNGQTLTLTLNETLSTTSPPLVSQFAVTTNGYPTSIQSLAVVGSTVVLTLSTPIGSGKTASVTYTAPTSVNNDSNSALQDTAGNDAATFTRSLSPNSSTVDQTGPTLSRSDVNSSGSAVILTFNEALNATTADPSIFVITTDGNPVTITSVTVSGSTVVLSTATTLEKNDIVRVSYTAPTVDNTSSNSAIQDAAGNDAGSITLGTVTANGSGTDTKGPALSTTVPTIGSNGLTMTLSFNEALSATTAPASAFTVLVNGVSVVPSSVTISGSTAVLNFSQCNNGPSSSGCSRKQYLNFFGTECNEQFDR